MNSATLFPRPARALCVLAALLAVPLFHVLAQSPAGDQTAPDRLISKPASGETPAPALKTGEEVRTAAGQQRRLSLGDYILYVNAKTTVRREQANRLVLSAGEIYLEAVPKGTNEQFTVTTPQCTITGRSASFAVKLTDAGPDIVVIRGQVDVSDLKTPIYAGQQLAAKSTTPAPAPRLSHAIAWARDLMIAAESPLVPVSKHAGGSLIARDPNGDEAKLELRKYHVDVHIEDGFARTTIDQTYFSDASWRLEGTFYFPLPPDASLSRLAMYVDGNLMEGGMAEREYARQVYETIRYTQQDPALLEWLDGSTFKMRVFPLEPRQEKRILLSYTQKLPTLYGQTTYRFPAGHSLQKVRDWSFHARVKNGSELAWSSASHPLAPSKDLGDLVLNASEKNVAVDRDIVLDLIDRKQAGQPRESARFATAVHEKATYLMVNYQPKLEGPTRTQQRDWVFLFESSGDRNPLVARVQIDVIRHLLRHAEPADRFAVLTAGSRVRGFGKELQAVTPENVQAALNFLEGSHLIGALDLAQALTEAQALLKQAKNPHLVHVGSGIPAMGERRDDQLIKLVPAGTRYVGVGVGRRWNRSLMKAAAERSGGLFTQINPDEPVGWRAFDLFASLNTPRLFNAQVTAEGCPPFLVFDPSVSEGEELAAVTRLGPGQDLPANITVRGTVNGKPFERIVPVKNVALHADYLPRSWARLEIDRLLIEEPVKNKDAIIALSKAMYVMTPYTSLLVLENEDLYTQYKVDRGRKDHWAMYPAPARIDIVYEPEPGMEGKDRKLARTAKQVLDTVVVRTSKGGKTPREPDVIALGVTDMPPERRPFIAGLPPAGETPSLAVFGRPAREVPDGGIAINGGLAERTSFRESERLEVLRKRLADSIHEQRIVTSRIVRSDEKQLARLATAVDDSLSMSLELGLQSATKLKLASKDRAEAGYGLRGFGTRLDGNALAGARGEPGRPLGRKLSKAIDDLGNGIFENLKTPEAVDVYAGELVKSSRTRPSLLYQRPTFRGEDRYFFDLASYAPGMNTSVADIYATIEREATLGPLPKPGLIDGSARDLLDRARVTTWHAWQLPDESGQPGYTIYFDGQGRYSYERTLPFGLKERVVCDGDTLLHLYPQLYLAARRSVSRFHRSAFFNFVPWALPKAEDLARDADLKVVADRTVAVVPHGIEEWKDKDGKPLPYHRLHFVFAANGPLAERQIVRMPAGEIIAREVYSEDGIIRVLDDKGKELVVQKGTLRKAAAPSLSPDTSKLVVVPLPFRTRDHVVRQLKVEKKGTRDLMLSQALPVLTADFGSGDRAHAQSVFREVFAARDQRQLGLYVLLASIGQNLDAENEDVLGEHPEEALSQYLALHTSSVLRKHATQWAATSRPWNDPFLQHLANTHALYQRWSSDRALKGTPAKVREDRLRAMAYVEANRTSLFGWGLLCLLQDRAGKDEPFNREIAESFRLFDDMASLRYAAQYEHARSLYRGGETGKARERFVKLYTATLDEDVLPSIDSEFRKALLGKGEESDLWSELIHKTAHRLIQHKHRAAVIALAWQCWQLDDQPLANQLLLTALEGVKDEQERTALTMAAIDFLMHSSQLVQADQLLQGLLQDAKLAERPSLWRLAASLAERRDLPDRALDCLETALDREVRKLPEVIDLQVVRAEYGKVLQHYQKLAEAMVTLKVQPPPNFVAKVVRAVDRWRALDPESADACHTAARILQRLGQKDLGWDYLTTPIAFRPAEAGPWLSLAQTLGRQGDLLLADRAYKAAYEAEPTNAQILWDRAVNLRQAGKTVEAQALFRQIAEGTWQPRFQGLRSQAKLQLQGS